MANKTSYTYELTKGIWKDNPTLVQIIGLCAPLAVTNTAINGLGMGLASTFVLICSSAIISALKKIFSPQIRIMGYVMLIASFVTLVDIYMKAKLPDLSKALGIFVPLIVVNCAILGRAEAFANKNNVFVSILDAVGMGIGLTIAFVLMGVFRELLGYGTIFTIQIMGKWFKPWIIMLLPSGAFFTLAVIIALKKYIDQKLLVKNKVTTQFIKHELSHHHLG